jgi:hypothetical protein
MNLAEVDDYLRIIQPDDAERDACILEVVDDSASWHDTRKSPKSAVEAFGSMLDWGAGLPILRTLPPSAKRSALSPSRFPDTIRMMRPSGRPIFQRGRGGIS